MSWRNSARQAWALGRRVLPSTATCRGQARAFRARPSSVLSPSAASLLLNSRHSVSWPCSLQLASARAAQLQEAEGKLAAETVATTKYRRMVRQRRARPVG